MEILRQFRTQNSTNFIISDKSLFQSEALKQYTNPCNLNTNICASGDCCVNISNLLLFPPYIVQCETYLLFVVYVMSDGIPSTFK
jgi:hypothetical protein